MSLPAGDQYWYSKVLGLHCDGANNSTTFTDVKGKTVTAYGNAKISTAQYPSLTGKSSSALFDGAGDYLSIPDSADWNFGSGDFTIRFLCRPTSTSADQEILAQRKTADSNNFWFIRRTSAEKIRVYAKAGGSIITDVLSTGTLTVDSWQLVEIVRTSGSVKISISGTFGTAVTTDGSGSWPDVAQAVYVGVGDDSFGAGNFYNGYLSEIEIYKGYALNTANFTPTSDPFPDTYVRISGTTKDFNGNLVQRLVRVYRRDTGALVGASLSNETTGEWSVTAANSGTKTPLQHFAIMHTSAGPAIPFRVLALHCDGTNASTTFSDLHGKTVTATGNAQISTAQYPSLTGKTSSGYLDGTGDYLSVPASSDFLFGSGSFTLRAFWRFSTFSTNQTIAAVWEATTAANCAWWWYAGSSTSIVFAFRDSDGSTYRSVSFTVPTMSTNTWYELELVRNESTFKLFISGTQQGSDQTNAAIMNSPASIGLRIGSLNGASYDATGYFSEIEIYKGCSLHTASYTGASAPFDNQMGTATDNAALYDDVTPY